MLYNIRKACYKTRTSSKIGQFTIFLEWFIKNKDKLPGKSDGTLYFIL